MKVSSPRLWGAIIIMQKRANSARRAARAVPDQDSQQAAALRGKATAHEEDVALLKRLDKGWRLPAKSKDYDTTVRFIREEHP